MDAVDILKVCARRWYVMLPILVGAGGVSYQLLDGQETTYTAHASYGLVQTTPPAAPAKGEQPVPNPLGANDGAIVGAALEAQLNSRQTQQELGGGATRGWGPGEPSDDSFFSVEIPLYETTYEVRAWGEDEREVRAVVNRVVAAAPRITAELQDRADAPPAGRYRPFLLAPTQVEDLPSTSGKKLVVAVMGVGVLMGAAWSIVADRVLRQLSRSRARRREEERKEQLASPRPSETVRLDGGGSAPDDVHDWQWVGTPVGALPRRPRPRHPPGSLALMNGRRTIKVTLLRRQGGGVSRDRDGGA